MLTVIVKLLTCMWKVNYALVLRNQKNFAEFSALGISAHGKASRVQIQASKSH